MPRNETMQSGAPEQFSLEPLPVRISDSLFPEVQKHYDAALTPSQQLHYERGLYRIQRMGGLRDEGVPIPISAETNLEHVVEGCTMAREFSEQYPILSNSVNFVQVQKNLLWHDAGEFLIGDVPLRNRTPEQIILKTQEAQLTHKRLLTRIANEQARDEVRQAYDLHVGKDQNDPNALMSALIDKLQGLRKIAAITTDMIKTNPTIRDQMRTHFFDTLHPTIEPAMRLLVILKTQEEREAVQTLFSEEMQRLIDLGHGQAVYDFMNRKAA